MQKDFHFYVTYGLCRCWGFDGPESQIIASASQFTDDCVVFRKLPKPDGELYQPIETQCQPQRAMGRQAQRDILRPFHFRSEEGNGGVVRAGNPAAADLVNGALLLRKKSKDGDWFHALGIALHAYVDTYSHQGFSPYRVPENTVDDLAPASGDAALLRDIMGSFCAMYPNMPPRIGHAEAYHCPDVPFLVWTYRNNGDISWIGVPADGVSIEDGFIRRDNPKIACAAVRGACGLVLPASGRAPNRRGSEIEGFFSPEAFRELDTLDHREAGWREKILKARSVGGFFDFLDPDEERYFKYVGNVWPAEAYGYSMAGGRARYGLRPNYRGSEWWKFQQAAKWARDFAA
jgi:hypothetical protein